MGDFAYLKEPQEEIHEVHQITVQRIGKLPVAKGDWTRLPVAVRRFVGHWVSMVNSVRSQYEELGNLNEL